MCISEIVYISLEQTFDVASQFLSVTVAFKQNQYSYWIEVHAIN